MSGNQRFSTSAMCVTDALPWPIDCGYSSADVWAQPSLVQNESEQLDDLIGLALIDPAIRDRLVVQHDPALLDSFHLSDDTRHRLDSIQANNLQAFAEAVMAASNPLYRQTTAEAA